MVEAGIGIFFENMISNRSVRWHGIEQIKTDEHVEPRTAFSTRSADFHKDLQLYRRAMDAMPLGLKFVPGKTEATVDLKFASNLLLHATA